MPVPVPVPVYLFLWLSVYLFLWLSVYLFLWLSVYLFLWLSVYLYLCLFVYLSLFLSLFSYPLPSFLLPTFIVSVSATSFQKETCGIFLCIALFFYHSPTRCPLSPAPSSLYQNQPRVSLPYTVFPLSKFDIDSLLRSPFGNFFLFTFLRCHFRNYSFYLPSRGKANHYKFPFGNLRCSSIPGKTNCFGFTFGNLFCSSIHLAEPSFASLLLETSAVHLPSGKANCCKFPFGNFCCPPIPR